MKVIPTSEYPDLLQTLQSLGETDSERAAALDVGHTKTVERLRKRIPVQMWPFVKSPYAKQLLRALLQDLERAA